MTLRMGVIIRSEASRRSHIPTGGSELRPNATQTEEQDFNNFWSSEYVRWYDRDWTDWCYNEGSVTVHHPFYMIYSVADLPIKHFTAKSVWQPKKWGE